jgi:hypothetical protein
MLQNRINLAFLNDTKYRAADYAAGAEYAQQHGWLEFKGTTIRLLKASDA